MFGLFGDSGPLVFLIVGLLFSLIGGGAFGYEFYWRLKAKRVFGRISAVRVVLNREGITESSAKKGSYVYEFYYPVYEYISPNGEKKELVSSIGYQGIKGLMAGRRLRLLLIPGQPDKIRAPALSLLYVGAVFFLFGLCLMSLVQGNFEGNFFDLVLSHLEGNFHNLLFGLVFLGFGLFSYLSALKKIKAKGGGVSGIPEMRDPVKNGRILSDREILERVAYYAKSSTIIGYMLSIIAVGVSIGSYYAALDMLDIHHNAHPASGVVSGFRSYYSDHSYTYYAQIDFLVQDRQDNTHKIRFEDSVGSPQRLFDRGESVDVLFYPDDPQKAIVDRGIWNWGLSGGLALGAFLALCLGFPALIGGRSKIRRSGLISSNRL
ncbi:MAG: DUF3592 domain-containing protein [Alphaproteobacteria bacterium]